MTTFQNTQSNGTHTSGEDQGFGQRVDQIGSEAQQLWSNARSAVSDLGQTLDLKGRVERNPYADFLRALSLLVGCCGFAGRACGRALTVGSDIQMAWPSPPNSAGATRCAVDR